MCIVCMVGEAINLVEARSVYDVTVCRKDLVNAIVSDGVESPSAQRAIYIEI